MTNQPISVFEKFGMIRCIIAVAHADGVMVEEEVSYLMAFVNRIPFTPEQKKQLLADIKTPQDVGALFAQINNPVVRSQVLYFARILAFKDGELHPSEEKLLNHLHANITGAINFDEIKTEARKVAQAEIDFHEFRMENQRPRQDSFFVPLFYLLDQVLLKLGIDLLR